MLNNLSPAEKEILNQIKAVIDPEVAINIVDLGLIYNVIFNENHKSIVVDMTLSARGCPVGDTILQNVETVVQDANPDCSVQVNLVWEPRWTPSLITEEGKAALNR